MMFKNENKLNKKYYFVSRIFSLIICFLYLSLAKSKLGVNNVSFLPIILIIGILYIADYFFLKLK